MATSSAESRRLRRTARVRYPNDDSESEDYPEYFASNPRPSRAARQIHSYRESSDDDESESSADGADSEQSFPENIQSPPSRATPQQAAALSKKRKTARSKVAQAHHSLRSNKRRKIQSSHLALQKDDLTSEHEHLCSNARIPAWQTLPYFVLTSIMQYAAYPLYGPQSRQQPSVSWLCTTGRLCRAFHDACTGALLYRPPLYPLERAQGLMRLLEHERDRPSTLSTSYRSKIRYLDIEVKQLLARKNCISLDTLISLTPQLKGIRLYSNYDDMPTVIWAKPEAKKLGWSYPPDLARRLEGHGLTLRSFHWNGRFPTTPDVLREAMAAHNSPSFAHLHDLTLTNLTLIEKADPADTDRARTYLHGALQSLPDLRTLSFRNCAVLDDVTMPMLPSGLLRLEITNCVHLTSDLLEAFLSTSGSTLLELKLNNNQSMSLGFMSDFKSPCPNLQRLEIDMVYIDPSSWHDRDPLFDDLLPKGPPTWPNQLVYVSIENMRQITEADADKFFASLVDAAEELPYLKTLNLKVILKGASWRERAKLRQKWMPVVEQVFLNTDIPMATATRSSHKRQSTRIANNNTKRLNLTDSSDDSDIPATRTAQPRCDVVDLVISDQRPAETQFRENDFLDSEPSDDDEYRD